MNVLSLFDGMSCGQLALKKAGIPYNTYFASEIDKYAIKVTQENFPETVQLGDVTQITGEDLPQIDLLIGGSPCQGFSFAGKQLNFEDPRSKLFFEYVRLLKECKPKYFLLENVKMKQEYQDVISEALGVSPVFINSALVSAHDRKRYYWTSIPLPELPTDKGILLKDVLEPEVCASFYLTEDKASRYTETSCKFSEKKSNVIGKLSKYQGDRVFSTEGKSSSLSAFGGNNAGGSCNLIIDPATGKLRRLTPVECERLQCVPEGYTACIPANKRFQCLGNGWTVDVIVHIIKNMEIEAGSSHNDQPL